MAPNRRLGRPQIRVPRGRLRRRRVRPMPRVILRRRHHLPVARERPRAGSRRRSRRDRRRGGWLVRVGAMRATTGLVQTRHASRLRARGPRLTTRRRGRRRRGPLLLPRRPTGAPPVGAVQRIRGAPAGRGVFRRRVAGPKRGGDRRGPLRWTRGDKPTTRPAHARRRVAMARRRERREGAVLRRGGHAVEGERPRVRGPRGGERAGVGASHEGGRAGDDRAGPRRGRGVVPHGRPGSHGRRVFWGGVGVSSGGARRDSASPGACRGFGLELSREHPRDVGGGR